MPGKRKYSNENRIKSDNTRTVTRGGVPFDPTMLARTNGLTALPINSAGMPYINLPPVDITAPINSTKYGMRAENPKYETVRKIEAEQGVDAARRWLYSTQLGDLSDKMGSTFSDMVSIGATMDLPLGKLFEATPATSTAKNRIFQAPSLFSVESGGLTANPNYTYRLVSKEGLKDAQKSGVVRNAWEAGVGKKPKYGSDVYWTQGSDKVFYNPHNFNPDRVLLEIPNDKIKSNTAALWKDISNVYENVDGQVIPMQNVFEKGGTINNNSNKMKVRIKSVPKGASGLSLGNGSVSEIGSNYISPTMEFNGPSHSNGGIDINYAGVPAEVEGGEPFFQDSNNNLQIFGKLKVPGSSKTFKSVAKDIAKEETKNSKILDKSMDLVNSNDPYDKFQKYSFNSGLVMGQYAQSRQVDLNTKKEQLAALQNMVLIDKEATKQAKWGKKIEYAEGGTTGPGKGSVAQRHNNPGNIKYAKWLEKFGATPGEAAKDGGNFAVFPSIEQGQAAMIDLLNKPTYKNKTVKDAIKTWTGGGSYQNIPMDIRNTKVSELNRTGFRKLLDTITFGEDSKKYNWENTQPETPLTGYNLPPVEVTARKNPNPNVSVPDPFGDPNDAVPPQITPFTNIPQTNTFTSSVRPVKPLGDLNIPDKKRLPSLADQNKLSFGQIAPELLTLATERRQFVPGQRYNPQLYTPYQVSFQDQLNQNQSTYSDVVSRVGNNASALGALAAQKYTADSQVMANEFRTNQEISNQITNQNTSLLNQAELTNLELQDRQFVRQTQADANTRANIRGAITSITNKSLQNNRDNNTIRLYENMFNYRPDEDLNLQYMGDDPVFMGGLPTAPQNQTNRVVYDKNGNVMRTTVITPSQLKTTQDLYKTEEQRKKNILNRIF